MMIDGDDDDDDEKKKKEKQLNSIKRFILLVFILNCYILNMEYFKFFA